MSTRATIHFRSYGETEAIVYRHSDGYPAGLGKDLKLFFKDVKAQCEGTMNGTRFNDPAYLAAKFVVWQADKYCKDIFGKLNFVGIGVCLEDPGDIQYRYILECTDDKPPKITIEEIG